ncbi:MAG: DOMON-like domain-containing protein [Bdellovibrionales bacterium]|nr:DOMON-like domain-containing protein [Bdellovibrionales bacterium]
MLNYSLKPFTPPPSPISMGVELLQLGGALQISFCLKGAVDSLKLPQPVENPERREGLFHHTCLELFIQKGNDQYLEFNFSFTGDWCVFYFDGYRKKSMNPITLDSTLFELRHISHSPCEASLKVNIPVKKIDFLGAGESTLGLSAVLEHPFNILSYWALVHNSTKPDFHQASSFIAKL